MYTCVCALRMCNFCVSDIRVHSARHKRVWHCGCWYIAILHIALYLHWTAGRDAADGE